MSIFNALFGGGSSSDDDETYYTDTDSQGDTSDDAYMYRSDRNGYTPLTKSQYRDETKDDWKNGYYDDPIFKSDDDDDDEPKPWWSLW